MSIHISDSKYTIFFSCLTYNMPYVYFKTFCLPFFSREALAFNMIINFMIYIKDNFIS